MNAVPYITIAISITSIVYTLLTIENIVHCKKLRLLHLTDRPSLEDQPASETLSYYPCRLECYIMFLPVPIYVCHVVRGLYIVSDTGILKLSSDMASCKSAQKTFI